MATRRGKDGPKHATAWASFEDQDDLTKVTLYMVFTTAVEIQTAKGVAPVELGLQTLGKLDRFFGTAMRSESRRCLCIDLSTP